VGPEGETSFSYGVNKNFCFFACPVASRRLCYGARRAFEFLGGNFFFNFEPFLQKRFVPCLTNPTITKSPAN